jgi:hypothetical protein
MPPVTPEPRRPAEETRSSEPNDEAPSAGYDKEARLFYERLEQTGQLVDVDANTDIAALPPHVTHVRYPDGTVERIGFSASPYGVR